MEIGRYSCGWSIVGLLKIVPSSREVLCVCLKIVMCKGTFFSVILFIKELVSWFYLAKGSAFV